MSIMKVLFLSICFICVSCSASKEVEHKTPKISVMTVGNFEDKGFSEYALRGANKAGKELGIEVVPKESKTETYLADLEALKDNGSNFIWLLGYQLSAPSITVALENPDIKYAIIDGVYDKSDSIPDNLVSVSFRFEEGAFLVGFIASRVSKTGKLGFIGAMSSEVIDSFRYGYEAGAKYANKHININSDYVGSYNDAEAAKTMTNKMYNDGIDIVLVVAGPSKLGVFEAAKERGEGYYAIGSNLGDFDVAPDNIIVCAIASADKSIHFLTSNYFKKNIFEGGRIINYGLKEGFVEYIKNPKNLEIISLDLEKEVGNITEKIINGDIIVPATEKDYHKYLVSMR
ncbi:BMP family ABC transporter substrate-binding protein (plasmid) [Candidatus Borreliella tachyglossi]|uniref:BMP family ABC transporter substrate-binding protein n=1 Tax=Candidatus Borreliella tachyglossi TaxID=1964448 RepID=A0A2S1LYL1_9SPIR|nr:BMP family protein [Candidatus Borreliella tachyglossi]AWG43335.1 BMP family ABC transporter substrate-binding protein [Candidatus Borreliella tachyglossi]